MSGPWGTEQKRLDKAGEATQACAPGMSQEKGAPHHLTLTQVSSESAEGCAAALLPYLLLELAEFLLQRLFLFAQPGRYHQHVGSWCRGRTQDIILYRHDSKCTRRPTSVHPVFTPTFRPAYSSLWPCPKPLVSTRLLSNLLSKVQTPEPWGTSARRRESTLCDAKAMAPDPHAQRG